jgi:hypothetical protein
MLIIGCDFHSPFRVAPEGKDGEILTGMKHLERPEARFAGHVTFLQYRVPSQSFYRDGRFSGLIQ